MSSPSADTTQDPSAAPADPRIERWIMLLEASTADARAPWAKWMPAGPAVVIGALLIGALLASLGVSGVAIAAVLLPLLGAYALLVAISMYRSRRRTRAAMRDAKAIPGSAPQPASMTEMLGIGARGLTARGGVYGAFMAEGASQAGPMAGGATDDVTARRLAKAWRGLLLARHEAAAWPDSWRRIALLLSPLAGVTLFVLLMFQYSRDGAVYSLAFGYAFLAAAAIVAALMWRRRKLAKRMAAAARSLNGQSSAWRNATVIELNWLNDQGWGPTAIVGEVGASGYRYVATGHHHGAPAMLTVARRLPRVWDLLLMRSACITSLYLVGDPPQDARIEAMAAQAKAAGFHVHRGAWGVRLSRDNGAHADVAAALGLLAQQRLR